MKKLNLKRIFKQKNRKETTHSISSVVLGIFLLFYSLCMLGGWFIFHWITFLVLSAGSFILSCIIFVDASKRLIQKSRKIKLQDNETPKS